MLDKLDVFEVSKLKRISFCVDGGTAEDGLTGSAWGDWANYTASPLRAFENELGVQDPVGFWDPAGCLGHHCLQRRMRQLDLGCVKLQFLILIAKVYGRRQCGELQAPPPDGA